jgi:cation:H+ antiporter
LDFLFLFLGITGLWIGTNLTIGGALSIARRHNLSELFVGLIILSIGSDLPELAVAIDAGLKTLQGQNASGVVIGSAIGSVVAQISFVLGVVGLISFLTLAPRYIFRHGAMLLGATLLLIMAAWDGHVSALEGLSLIVVYIMYVVILLAREKMPDSAEAGVGDAVTSPWIRLTSGLVVIIASSELAVQSVVNLATIFQVNDTVISVLVIGMGTSLPELTISLGAIFRKRIQLSVGNIIGSNVFDTLVPVGAASLIAPVVFERGPVLFDLVYVFFLTLIVLFLFYRIRGLQKWEAGLVLGLYLVYVVIKLFQL